MTRFDEKGRVSPGGGSWWKPLPDPFSVAPAVTASVRHPQQYLITKDMGYLEDKMNTCAFCKWAFEHVVLKNDIEDYTIWITDVGRLDHVTGLPVNYKVYIRNNVKNMGHSSNWSACYNHGYLAYLDYQQIMLDELRDWELTDRWMQNRNGRI